MKCMPFSVLYSRIFLAFFQETHLLLPDFVKHYLKDICDYNLHLSTRNKKIDITLTHLLHRSVSSGHQGIRGQRLRVHQKYIKTEIILRDPSSGNA